MATIGYLRLLFGADTKELEAKSKKARDEIKKSTEGMNLAGGAAKVYGAIAGGIAAVGLVAMTKSAMDGINATRGLAERVGTSSEALSKLEYAAAISDVSSEDLGKTLEKMQVRLGAAAATGEGKTAKALDAVGLSAADLVKQDPVETFHQMLDVLGDIENPAERASVAMDLFGKTGVGMTNLVVQGGDAIREMEAEADRFGVTIKDIDAAKVDEADDAMTKVWSVLGGIGKALAIGVAPWITEVSNLFTNWAGESFSATAIVEGAIHGVVTAVGYVADVVQVLQAGFYAASGGIVSGMAFVLEVFNAAQEGANQLIVTFIDWGLSGIDAVTSLSGVIFGFFNGLAENLRGFAEGFDGWLDFLLRPIADLLKALGVLPQSFEIGVAGPLVNLASRFTATNPLEGMTEGMRGGLQGMRDAFAEGGAEGMIPKSLIEGFNATADEQMKKASDVWGADWAHTAVQSFADSVTAGADERAGEAVEGAEKFRGLGAGVEDASKEDKGKKFAGALDVGSKEAYSAILAARGVMRGDKTPERTAKATERTAAATEAMKSSIDSLAQYGATEDEVLASLEGA